MRRNRLVVLAVAVSALITSGASAGPYLMYRITSPNGPQFNCGAVDLNASGTVLCRWETGIEGGTGCGLWNRGVGVVDITSPGLVDRAGGINDKGQVAVQGYLGGGVRNADGTITPLQDSADLVYTRGINNSGQVAGVLFQNPSQASLVQLTTTGAQKVIWRGFSDYSFPAAINDSGSMVWWAMTTTVTVSSAITAPQAYMWDGHEVKLLPDAQQSAVGASKAWDINDLGQVAGSSGGNAVVWNPDGSIRVLGHGEAYGINNLGQAVGFVWEGTGDDVRERGVVWNADGTVVCIDDYSEGASVTAWRINDHGQIAGTAKWNDSATVAAMWEPVPTTVPEPASLLAMGCGLVGLGGRMIRRKRS